jgi:Flp pilus assembly pilin Flp
MPLRHLIDDARGATAIEYGLIAALIAIMAIPAIMGVAAQQDQTYQQAASGLGKDARD